MTNSGGLKLEPTLLELSCLVSCNGNQGHLLEEVCLLKEIQFFIHLFLTAHYQFNLKWIMSS